jgi:hypothetical protein
MFNATIKRFKVITLFFALLSTFTMSAVHAAASPKAWMLIRWIRTKFACTSK